MCAIPETEDPSVYEEKDFKGSGFVEIVSGELFEVSMQYPLLKMKNAEERCFVRKEVYERLIEAAGKLPGGYRFRILDAWRPFALQQELYETYSEDIIREFELENCTEEYRKEVIRRFVSEPVRNADIPPVHTTGGAVDLTVVKEDGKELDMGSGFDEFTDRTNTAFYEKHFDPEITANRRLLYSIMTGAGFTNLPSEWWHYDYGDRFWAFYKKRPAIYGGVFTKEELL